MFSYKWKILAEDENIPPGTYYDERREGDHEEDYDDYNTSNTTVNETPFTIPCSNN